MFDDDDIFFDEEGFAEDNQLTIVDEAIIKLLDTVISTVSEMKTNKKFNESQDFNSNLSILRYHMSSLDQLSELDSSDISDEEAESKISDILNGVLKSTTELKLGNIDDVLGRTPDNETKSIVSDEDTDGTDW